MADSRCLDGLSGGRIMSVLTSGQNDSQWLKETGERFQLLWQGWWGRSPLQSLGLSEGRMSQTQKAAITKRCPRSLIITDIVGTPSLANPDSGSLCDRGPASQSGSCWPHRSSFGKRDYRHGSPLWGLRPQEIVPMCQHCSMNSFKLHSDPKEVSILIILLSRGEIQGTEVRKFAQGHRTSK